MPINEWIILGLICIYLFGMIGMIFLGVNELQKMLFYQKERKKIRGVLNNILKTFIETQNYEKCITEINILFKNVIMSNEILSKEFSSVSILLEKVVLDINLKSTQILEEDWEKYKEAALDLLEEYNERNPMEQIKGADSIALQNVMECFERGDIDKGKNAIKQLAIEIYELKKSNMEKDQNSKKQDFYTKMGIVLSIVFGIISVIQLFI